MSINKSQGQTLGHVGLYLPRPVFTHGQLYIAISRVQTRDGLKILIGDGDDSCKNSTLILYILKYFKKFKLIKMSLCFFF
jgi:ATP-dependent DNA helicase PIF1